MITAFHVIVRDLWSLGDQFQEIRQNRVETTIHQGIDLRQLHNYLLFLYAVLFSSKIFN